MYVSAYKCKCVCIVMQGMPVCFICAFMYKCVRFHVVHGDCLLQLRVWHCTYDDDDNNNNDDDDDDDDNNDDDGDDDDDDNNK